MAKARDRRYPRFIASNRDLLGVTQHTLYMLDKKKKEKVIEKFATHKGDTGSPEVQIALLSAEMADLQEHLTQHKKDFSSRRGLLRKVSERRKLLKYLEVESAPRAEALKKKLKL